jgi:hypothetical protein
MLQRVRKVIVMRIAYEQVILEAGDECHDRASLDCAAPEEGTIPKDEQL